MSWARDVWPSERARLMGAHMQPIERLAAEATVEIVELESWLDDELRCESFHAVTGPTACTITVTHFSTIACINSRRHVCAVTARSQQDGIKAGGNCLNCGHPVAECWKVVPI